MAIIVCPECAKEYSNKARACPNCGCPREYAPHGSIDIAQNNIVPPIAVVDPFSLQKVIQHLSYAAILEKSIFTYKRIHKRLESRISQLGHPQRIAEPPDSKQFKVFSPMWAFFPIFLIVLVILSAESGDLISDLISVITVILIFFNNELLERALIAALIGVGGALFCVVIKAISVRSTRKKLIRAYREALAKDQERVSAERRLIQHLRQQQSDIQSHINKNAALLENLYSLDIIFPKYRHMVAVLTILEYLQAQRCTQLTGHEGAYNLFEHEERQNKIIAKLDVAIGMLDQLRKSQFLLYEAICDANNTLQRVQSQSERIAEASSKIEANTALTAYNTSVIRNNTEISAYIDTFYRS
ncbi:MAG: zinc ribbon domain-containing protein [Clostridia bacterium]|nr:zinc ribbon domain-containing protein [Clostridia bacterium]